MTDVYEDIVVNAPRPGVVLLTIDRPDARNALRNNTLREIAQVIKRSNEDDSVHALVITGGEKVFAAGADIKEMAKLGPIEALTDIRPEYWKVISTFSKPLIAAVNGYALGAGCEMVMHVDVVIAGETAKFGQPEINLGTIPGAGGTQRLIRTVGKPLAMKMVLSGVAISAEEALAAGLITEITNDECTLERALDIAATIATKSPVAVRLAKESMLKAFEIGLDAGLNFERKAFSLLAASVDRREGINAFLEKRQPLFVGK